MKILSTKQIKAALKDLAKQLRKVRTIKAWRRVENATYDLMNRIYKRIEDARNQASDDLDAEDFECCLDAVGRCIELTRLYEQAEYFECDLNEVFYTVSSAPADDEQDVSRHKGARIGRGGRGHGRHMRGVRGGR